MNSTRTTTITYCKRCRMNMVITHEGWKAMDEGRFYATCTDGSEHEPRL